MEVITFWVFGLLATVVVVSAIWAIVKVAQVVFFRAMRRLSSYDKRFMAFVRI